MADNTIAQAYVQIIPSAKGIKGSIQNAVSPEASRAGVAAGTNISGSLSNRLKTVGASLAKSGALISAISVPLIAGINKALDAYQVQLESETKLTEIYKTRMGASEDAAQATMDYASALQAIGVVGDEVTLSGAQQLATFAKYPSTVETLLPAMDDLLVQQHGLNASTADAVSVANLMGKAMNGNAGALRRVGITLDESQEKILKYGTEEERAAVLSEVITQNVGHMNEEMAKTPLGKIQQMKNSMGDLKEEIGAALAPAVSQLAQMVSEKVVPALQKMIEWMQQHPTIAKVVVAVTALLAVLGPLLIVIGAIASGIGALIPVFTALSGPVGIVIGVITALTAVGVLLWKNWDKIKEKATEIWGKIKTSVTEKVQAIKDNVKDKFDALKNSIASTLETIRDKIVSPFERAHDKVVGFIDKIKNLFPLHLGKIFEGIQLPHFKISGGKIPWGVGGMGKAPNVDVEWYRQGGIMTRPTIFGGGEAGSEAILPLDPFWKEMNRMADAMTGSGVTINVYASEGQNVNDLAAEVERRLINAQKRRMNAWR